MIVGGRKQKTKKKLSGFCRANQHLIYLENCFSQSIPQVCVYLSGPCIKSNVSLPLATNSLPFPPTRTPFSSYSFSFFFFFYLRAAAETGLWRSRIKHTHTNEYCIWRAPWSPNVAESFFGERKKQEPIGHHTISLIPHPASVVNNQIEIERLTCHRNDVMYIQMNDVKRYTQYGTDQITWNWN